MSHQTKILWLESGDLYTIRKGIEAGAKLGVQVDSLETIDLRFIVDGARIGVFAQGRNLADYYDALIVRSFMPHISEALMIARLFRDAGKVVVDAGLNEEALAMSKMHDYLVLAAKGIAVPRTFQCFDPAEAESHAQHSTSPAS
jgi:glutathione synthase/RimK-type ligase-like ATP-grasp enzyme